MARVRWTESALKDVETIVRYIAAHSPANAGEVFDGLFAAPDRLEQFPYSGSVVPEIREEQLREVLYHSYRIIYQLRDTTCWILSVVHASRDLTQLIDPETWADRE